MAQNPDLSDYLVAPDLADARLTRAVHGADLDRPERDIDVVAEQPHRSGTLGRRQ